MGWDTICWTADGATKRDPSELWNVRHIAAHQILIIAIQDHHNSCDELSACIIEAPLIPADSMTARPGILVY